MTRISHARKWLAVRAGRTILVQQKVAQLSLKNATYCTMMRIKIAIIGQHVELQVTITAAEVGF